MNFGVCLLVVPLSLAAWTSGMAQDQRPKPPPRDDPTELDESLMRVLGSQDQTPTRATTGANSQRLAIRGIVVPSGRAAVALLDVGEERVRVREGSEFGMASGEVMRVERVVLGEVVLRQVSTGETRTLR